MVERLAKNYQLALNYFADELKFIEANIEDYIVGLSANAYERGYIALLIGDSPKAESTL
ncbi:MAG: hypothetical protein AAFV93_00150 [Chloroflexota bacterium]